uniref:Growth hormone n=1 Tax=Denticeps clupeoides TaxID=299321 RepID=A0AAY4E1H3_9TELE
MTSTLWFLLLPILAVSFIVNKADAFENQRLFNNAVIRVQVLHQLAAKMITDFEESLYPDDRRALSKIFPLSHCISDSIEAPTGKDETQKSSVLRLLRTSSRLIESWEYPSQTFSTVYTITEKLTDLKVGVNVLIRVIVSKLNIYIKHMDDNDSLPLPFEDFYLSLDDGNLSKSYRLLACFRKDMHRVETFLRMANCRRSPEANCTL